ncbi:YncE family protein [Vulcanisaeta sp. JCM 14467]|uniref:YncE family protein n=1 Tax=Vulcanisaeta sp. JCM 14467 TaxID=1295370 RepID=UPI0006D095BE|nr:hypothetical protein [Vulcanisaeta sp. JCM 14467]
MLIGLSTPAIIHAESNNTNIGYVKYTLLCDNELQSGPLNYTVLCATSPRGIIYDPLNGYIYIADDYANTVDVLDPMNNSIIATIPVGLYPYYITYDPKNGYLYVTDNLVGVSIIATKPMPTSNIITPVTKPSVMSTALVVGVVVVAIIVVAAAVMLRMRMRK